MKKLRYHVGCGGAGFPTHAKYSGGPVETIIVNGAECEPRSCRRTGISSEVLRQKADPDERTRIEEETDFKEFIIALKAAYTREIKSFWSV